MTTKFKTGHAWDLVQGSVRIDKAVNDAFAAGPGVDDAPQQAQRYACHKDCHQLGACAGKHDLLGLEGHEVQCVPWETQELYESSPEPAANRDYRGAQVCTELQDKPVMSEGETQG